KIDAAGLWSPLSSGEAATIAGWIYERIHIRATEERGKTISQSIEMSEAQLAALATLVGQTWPDGLMWSDVLARVMEAAARLSGHERWGYNTPQDHLHLDFLFAAFPDAKAVFLLREPFGLLRSYKNVSGPWHDARRYNPTAIGLAWRAAARSYLRLKDERPEQVMLVRYHELTRHTSATLAALSAFLGVRIPQLDLAALGRNSSLNGGRARLEVSETEVWLAARPMRDELRTLGFTALPSSFSLKSLPTLAKVYLPSAAFHLKALLFDPDRRRRMLRLLQSSAGRPKQAEN
ncbi:MAG TPA: sulfotransferase, partial [Caulobacteraceae bacterium]